MEIIIRWCIDITVFIFLKLRCLVSYNEKKRDEILVNSSNYFETPLTLKKKIEIFLLYFLVDKHYVIHVLSFK